MSKGTKVVVVGAGLMGTGIAHGYATTGHQTVLVDTSAAQLEKAQASITSIIAGGVKLGKMSEDAAKEALANLTTSSSLADSAKGAKLLIETASERLEVKHAILREADALVAEDGFITTNTSALSITEIAAVTKNPKRVAGLHFFNPVHKMKLVEIIKGLETSDETVAYCHASVKALGKNFITVNENPGFATSRMSAMMGNEAMYMVYEGVASPEDVDTAMRMAFNHPMGPLELGDLTGWDTRLAVLEYLHKTMGEKFRPCPLIHKLVKSGRYGRKVGKGVYEYNEKGEKIPRLKHKGSLMREVVIVEAVRTPVGRFRGALKDVRADHLGAHVLNEIVRRTGIDVNVIDDVIFGCVTQVGEQCGNVARTSLISAGFPYTIPGVSLDRKCGSGEAAVHEAFAEIASGMFDVVVAGGVENMSRVPMGGNRDVHGETFGWKFAERFEIISQGVAAERIADEWNLSRDEIDDFAFDSQRRAAAAADAGYFDREIAPIHVDDWSEKDAPRNGVILTRDETIRRDTTREKLGTLKTVFRENGRITAGNSSQISDGAAVLLLMSADKARELGLEPRARIRAVTVVGSDPTLMLTGPIAATRKIFEKAGLSREDIDIFEVNEAFGSVPLVWMKEIGVSHDRLNVNGGAIALGHPLGASGARIMTSMLHELERRDATFGLQSICCAGGLGTATIIERLR